jgi:hypothetical protein
MAEAVSPASITCAGKTIASKQQTADRKTDFDMGSDGSRILWIFVIVSRKRFAVNAFIRICLFESHCR